MPESSDRHFTSHPFWRTLQVVLAAVLGSALLFVILTRTQVGRDGIRNQLETAFNERFNGTLSIGSLRGTIIDNFVATDVQLRDSSGRTVMSIDSIVAEPRWANLLSSELSVRTLTVLQPQVTMHRDSSGQWNLFQALEQRPPPSSEVSPLDLSFANIEIQGGRITTTRAGPAPEVVQSNWLFDYTRTQGTHFSVRASIERSGQTGQLEINNGSLTLSEPKIEVSMQEGRILKESDGWSFEQFDVSFDTTRLRGTASIEFATLESARPTFTLQLAQSRIDHEELLRIVPRLPFRDVVTVEGQMKGTTERFEIEEFTATHEASFASAEGSISKTEGPLDVDVALTDSRLAASDVREVWPGLPSLPDSSLQSVRADGSLRGTISSNSPPSNFNLEGEVQAQSQLGAVQGTLAVQRGSAPLSYTGSFEADSLNLAPLTGNPRLSGRLTGRMEIDGQRGSLGLFSEGTLNLSLSSSRLGLRRIAAANVDLGIVDGRAQGTLRMQQKTGGTLNLKGRVDQLRARPNFTAIASASNFNVSTEGKSLPPTRLHGRLTVQGSGVTWQSLTGTAVVEVDSSWVLRGERTVPLPPHFATIQVAARSSERPRVELSGSVLSLTLDGTTLGPPLWSATQDWGGALRSALTHVLEKPGPKKEVNTPEPQTAPSISPQDRFQRLEDRLSVPFRTTPPPSIRADAQLRVHEADVLHAWWPSFPETLNDFNVKTAISISSDSIHVSGQLSASKLKHQATEATNPSLEYELSGASEGPLPQTLDASLDFSAQRVTVGDVPLSETAASLSYGARSGTLRVRADSIGMMGATTLTADLNVTPERNELQVREASTSLRGHTWENESPATVAAYPGVVVVSPLTVKRAHPQTSRVQSIRIGGTLSSNPTDTLSVTAQNVYLPPISRALHTPNLIGGELSGTIHLRRGPQSPRITGDVHVRRLSYDRRILGHLDLQADYSTQSPDLRLEGSLESDTTSADWSAEPTLLPGNVRSVEPNEVSLSGRYRLPEWIRSSPRESSQIQEGETLDFNVQVERADLFFFRYIFEKRVANVQGYTAGSLHIGGRIQDPIFNADLTVENGAVTLPRFGLAYELSGPVEVDRRGIHLQDLSVRDDEGSATVWGSILFNDYQYFSFDLSGSVDGITVMDVPRAEDLPFYGHIRASGPVSLTGPLPDATLQSNSARTTPDSELFIPVSGQTVLDETGFIVFADSTGQVPDLESLTRRENILADRPEGEPSFVEGLNIDLNVIAPEGSTVNLVFDPVVGDMVTAVGSGRVQLLREEGEFQVYGDFNATSGTYLFTAGEVFVRRFSIREGTITWDGDPINAQLNLAAEYRTRASTSGLPGLENFRDRIPVTVQLDISGRVATPRVDLSLAFTRNEESTLVGTETIDAILNQPALRTEYATSVLLTNTFLLTTESLMQQGGTQSGVNNNRLTTAGNQLAFNSVSQLVSSQLNRYLGAAFSNLDVNFGVQGENPNDLDLIYGVALRLLNERLIIRGEGVYTGDEPEAQQARGPQGEFVVEVRLSPRISAKVFYRRTGDELIRNRALTSSRGAGLSFQTVFSTWSSLLDQLFGWMFPTSPESEEDEDPERIARQPQPRTDSTETLEQ